MNLQQFNQQADACKSKLKARMQANCADPEFIDAAEGIIDTFIKELRPEFQEHKI